MAGGFSFCGTDIATLGLEYAPDLEDVFVYRPASFESYIETYEGHNGGYYYGSWYSPKEFTLRCFFEDSRIDKGIMSQVFNLFRKGKSGKLIFDKRPWCYYTATVTDPVEFDLKNYENGVVTIKMKAFYPFARSDIIVHTRAQKYHDDLMNNSAVFEKEEMDKDREFTNLIVYHSNPLQIKLANPGQEYAALGVALAGDVGEGVIISNNTTGQSMKLVAITNAVTPEGKEVVVDPISGKTIVSGNGENKINFLYHDYGFLSLAPSFPAIRNVFINYNNDYIIEILNMLHQDIVGKYIFIVDEWVKITEQIDLHHFKTNKVIEGTGNEKTMIIPMNEITIDPVSNVNLRSLRFIFKPTYS